VASDGLTLDGLGWEVIDLDGKQHPGDSHRYNFTEVVMLPILRAQLKVINKWLEDDQVEEVVKRRFVRSVYNFFHLYRPLLDSWMLFDNSADLPHLIADEEGGNLMVIDDKLFSMIERSSRSSKNQRAKAGKMYAIFR
jgi:hypothetical protein